MTNKDVFARDDEHITGALVSVVCPFGRMVIAKDKVATFGQFGLVANRFSGNHGFFARC